MARQKLRDVALTIAIAVLVNVFWLALLTVLYGANDFPNGDKTVYTTRTGECYHLSGCSSLRRSEYKTTLRSAVKEGYYPCSNCNAPRLKGEDGFIFESVHYLVLVPMAALFAYAATGELTKSLSDKPPHYLAHLVLAALLSAGFDTLI